MHTWTRSTHIQTDRQQTVWTNVHLVDRFWMRVFTEHYHLLAYRIRFDFGKLQIVSFIHIFFFVLFVLWWFQMNQTHFILNEGNKKLLNTLLFKAIILGCVWMRARLCVWWWQRWQVVDLVTISHVHTLLCIKKVRYWYASECAVTAVVVVGSLSVLSLTPRRCCVLFLLVHAYAINSVKL